jgi:hypothetical protein
MYKVVQIWPGLFVCKQVTVCPGLIWTTLYILHLANTVLDFHTLWLPYHSVSDFWISINLNPLSLRSPSSKFWIPSVPLSISSFPRDIFSKFLFYNWSGNDRRKWWKKEGRRAVKSSLKWGRTQKQKEGVSLSHAEMWSDPCQCSHTGLTILM